MRLDAINKIETFMTDALLSSPQIPLGVNIVRLADTQDVEGIVALARSISVRYTGSSLALEQTAPMSIYRRARFEVTLASQSYLTNTGHDYVVQMCIGSHNTLLNQVPVNTGSQIIEPFHMVSEEFQGISNSTHYIYVQTWELTIQEIEPLIALDPCVARGNCSYLFPQDTQSVILPGDVLYKNILFSPVLPPAGGGPYDPAFCGVIENPEVEGQLVYKADPDTVFLDNWTTYSLVSTETFDETGEMLIVNIYDSNGDLYITEFFSNCDDRKVVQVAGAQPNSNAARLGGLVRSPIDNLGNPIESGVEPLPATMAPLNGFGYTNNIRNTVFVDPRDPNAATATVKYGALYSYQVGVTLEHASTTYVLVGGTPVGKAWIREQDLTVIPPADINPHIDCAGPEVEPGDGTSTGPLP